MKGKFGIIVVVTAILTMLCCASCGDNSSSEEEITGDLPWSDSTDGTLSTLEVQARMDYEENEVYDVSGKIQVVRESRSAAGDVNIDVSHPNNYLRMNVTESETGGGSFSTPSGVANIEADVGGAYTFEGNTYYAVEDLQRALESNSAFKHAMQYDRPSNGVITGIAGAAVDHVEYMSADRGAVGGFFKKVLSFIFKPLKLNVGLGPVNISWDGSQNF